MNLNERILAYLSKCPPAIDGQGGSDQTYAVACSLYNGFALTQGELHHYMSIYNQTCQGPWNEKDLLHKVEDAAAAEHAKPRGHLITGNGKFNRTDLPSKFIIERKPAEPQPDPRDCVLEFLEGFECGEADLVDASPVKVSDNPADDSRLFVETLFQSGEAVNFVSKFKLSKNKAGEEKANPDGFGVLSVRETLLSYWGLKGVPPSDSGVWIRINPVLGGISDGNVTSFRHILLEFDKIPMELQLAFFAKLPLPLCCVMTSGGRSLHAWVKADCIDEIDYTDTVSMILKWLKPYGLDAKNKNPSRLSRLPGVTRKIGASGDGRQRLLYLNPNPEGGSIL